MHIENNSGQQIPINSEVAKHAETIKQFSQIYYETPVINGLSVWQNTYWFGIRTLKCPLDLWLYQEIINNQKPDFIVECGVAFGGTTAFLADICNLQGKGRIIGVDISIPEQTRLQLNKYQNIYLIEGDSTAPNIVKQVFDISKDKNVLVILDSDHSKNHVLEELIAYSPLIQSGGYLIVEDTNVNGYPVLPDFGPGPMEAVLEFITRKEGKQFYIDIQQHKFLTTFNPNGYLRKS